MTENDLQTEDEDDFSIEDITERNFELGDGYSEGDGGLHIGGPAIDPFAEEEEGTDLEHEEQ